ncbi:MAG: putative toxin-antitoxin system toxin component, PIN family [Phycisphaeraceae bacterium]
MRVVCDVNVVVSAALLPGSIPHQALNRVLVTGRLVTSEDLIRTTRQTLLRPKFERYITEDERLEFLAALISDSELVAVTQRVTACRDVDDDMVLEAAVNGQATHIVTGDRDLLVLHPFRSIAILTPKDFVALPDIKA